MGCTASKDKSAASNAVGFVNGEPRADFPFDEKKNCTDKGNGLLFRLINRSTRQWAFYNDSKTYEFHVTVTFSAQSRVEALGNTTMVSLPNEEGFVAKTVIYPCETELFVEGDIDGFDAVYQAVMLTDEYKERKQAEKKAAKKKKLDENGEENGGNEDLDEEPIRR